MGWNRNAGDFFFGTHKSGKVVCQHAYNVTKIVFIHFDDGGHSWNHRRPWSANVSHICGLGLKVSFKFCFHHDVLDEILNHTLSVAWSPSSTTPRTSFRWKSHTLMTPKCCNSHWSCTFLSSQMPTCSNIMNLCCCQFTSTSRQTSQSLQMSGKTTFCLLDIQNLFKLSDLHSCLHLGDTFFCKGKKVIETSLKKSCLGSLYLANAEAI